MQRTYILLSTVFLIFFPLVVTPSEQENILNSEINIPMTIGDAEAPVKIIEYASFTCPHCATFHNEILPKLKNEFINTGKVQLEYREIYFDGPGLWAGLLARCKGPEKYFPMINLIYNKQKDWARGNRDDIIKGLLSIGRQSGLTDERSRECMENSNLAENLIDIFKKNVEKHKISSTPSFVINGELKTNMSYEELKYLIEKNLE